MKKKMAFPEVHHARPWALDEVLPFDTHLQMLASPKAVVQVRYAGKVGQREVEKTIAYLQMYLEDLRDEEADQVARVRRFKENLVASNPPNVT